MTLQNTDAYFRPTVNDPLIPLSGTVWRHYKHGTLYVVTGWSRHSETLEVLINYKVAHGDGTIWSRPERMWDERVYGENLDADARRFTFVALDLDNVSSTTS